MPNIEELIGGSTPRDVSGLLAVDPADLARYLTDPSHAWSKRRTCALALVGRVPDEYVSDLISRICDLGENSEVRAALLEAMPDREELLPWLMYEAGVLPHHSMPPILKARGRLGDLTAVSALATLAASLWEREGSHGRAGMAALVERYGLEAVLADVGDESPEARICQVRLRAGDGRDVTSALADPDRGVAYTAQSLIEDVSQLHAYLDEAPTDEAKLWTAYRLYELTHDAQQVRAVYEKVGRPRVEVPGLDEDLRRALLHEFAPRSQRQTDPRWRIEAICTEVPPPVDEHHQLTQLINALTATGLEPLPPLTAGEYHRQGTGNYHVVFASDHKLAVSNLGWFVRTFGSGTTDPAVQRAITAAGFRWIDGELADLRVTDLCVYHFGRRDALTVRELLFYWQD